MSNREHHRVPLIEWDGSCARLLPRPLLRENEFSAGEVHSGAGKQHRNLQREHVLPVNVLMEAVEITLSVFQQ
jgi:hypothetical protein